MRIERLQGRAAEPRTRPDRQRSAGRLDQEQKRPPGTGEKRRQVQHGLKGRRHLARLSRCPRHFEQDRCKPGLLLLLTVVGRLQKGQRQLVRDNLHQPPVGPTKSAGGVFRNRGTGVPTGDMPALPMLSMSPSVRNAFGIAPTKSLRCAKAPNVMLSLPKINPPDPSPELGPMSKVTCR